MTADMKKALEMIQIAREQGLKRLKLGSIEVELSDFELVRLHNEYLAKQGQAALENLTNANIVQETPSPGNEAKDTSQILTDTLPSIEDDPDLYLSTF